MSDRTLRLSLAPLTAPAREPKVTRKERYTCHLSLSDPSEVRRAD